MLRELSRLNFGLAYLQWKKSQFQRKQEQRAQQVFNDYFKNNTEKKIQFGSGANVLNGWLNTDANPKGETVFLDINKPLPFAENSFDFAFSEHVFGYLHFEEALFHLKEVKRILKPGGIYKVHTPNLDLVFNTDVEKEAYYAWYLKKFKVKNNGPEPVYFLNHFMKIAYGNYFHNTKSLKYLADCTSGLEAKFDFANQEVSYKAFQNLAYHNQVIGTDFNKLETLEVAFIKEHGA